jgi:hypothetical protein
MNAHWCSWLVQPSMSILAHQGRAFNHHIVHRIIPKLRSRHPWRSNEVHGLYNSNLCTQLFLDDHIFHITVITNNTNFDGIIDEHSMSFVQVYIMM